MAALNETANRGLLARNPVKLANTPRVESPEIEPYTVEQMCQLLDAAQGTRNAPRWTLAAVLGLRQGEVLGLQWADLDLTGAGTVTVRRQLQRLGWQHACENPSNCRTVSGTKAKRGADCPQRTGGGLVVRPVKSTAGRRALTLPRALPLSSEHTGVRR
jgi:integrase